MKTVTILSMTLICAALVTPFLSSAQTGTQKINETRMEVESDGVETTLRWITTREVNSSYFLVQKSADGKQFSPVKMLTAAGNSNFPRNYEFTEMNETGTAIYYRVVLVTMNGEQLCSAPTQLRPETDNNNVAIK